MYRIPKYALVTGRPGSRVRLYGAQCCLFTGRGSEDVWRSLMKERLHVLREALIPRRPHKWIGLQDMLTVCEPYDVISFDVFDTLLCRNVTAPEDVFRLLETENGVIDFALSRTRAEQSARARLGREITLAEIYEEMARSGCIADAEQGAEVEKRMEARVTAPHPRMTTLLRELQRRGKRVIAVSDMYLPSAAIGQLMEKAGCPAPDALYVSCEVGCGKAGGAIYRRVQEAEGAEKRILHIGDNWDADCLCAAQAGWDCALIVNTQRTWLLSNMNDPPSLAMSVWKSLTQRRMQCGELDDPAEQVGYTVTGPMVYGFCQYIRQQKDVNGWERVLFAARDGLIMHRIYTRFFGEAEYVPVSRAAVQMLAFAAHTDAYADNNLQSRIGSGEKLGDVLRDLGLGPCMEEFRRLGLDTDAVIDAPLIERFKLLLREHTDIAARCFEPAAEHAGAYFSGLLAGCSRAVLCDTGWKGTSGMMLQEFLRSRGMAVRLDQALLGTSKSPSVIAAEEGGRLFSYLYSPIHHRDLFEAHFAGDTSVRCSLIELLMMTDRPQLLSYAGENMTYAEAPADDSALSGRLQRGAMAFAEDMELCRKQLQRDVVFSPEDAYAPFRAFCADERLVLTVFGQQRHTATPTGGAGETFGDMLRASRGKRKR